MDDQPLFKTKEEASWFKAKEYINSLPPDGEFFFDKNKNQGKSDTKTLNSGDKDKEAKRFSIEGLETNGFKFDFFYLIPRNTKIKNHGIFILYPNEKRGEIYCRKFNSI